MAGGFLDDAEAAVEQADVISPEKRQIILTELASLRAAICRGTDPCNRCRQGSLCAEAIVNLIGA